MPLRCSNLAGQLLTCLLVLLCPIAAAFAADEAAPDATPAAQPPAQEAQGLELPKGVPPIPAPDDEGAKLFISSKNVSLFHEILIAPLAAWLKEGKLIIRVVKDLNFPWSYLPPWDGAGSAEDYYSLKSDRSLLLKDSNGAERGFPFGSAQQISEEKDPEAKAYKILWNEAYAQRMGRSVLYELDLSWVGAQSLLRYSTGGLFKYYPQVEAAEQDDLFMQEAFQLLDPPVVFGFSSITWRYLSGEEDRMWIYSPVTGRDRMLLSSNRSDNIVGSIITSDDVFVWSGKVQAFNAKVVDERVLLAPFSSLRVYDTAASDYFAPGVKAMGSVSAHPTEEAETEETGKASNIHARVVRAPYQTRAGTPSIVLWNHQSKRLPRAAPWAPVSVFFVPRDFWILELSPRDPFYTTGKMILAVDKQSMLPFYKVVYDRDGSLLKTVIGSWGLARETEASPRFPFAAFVLVVHAKENKVSTLTTQQVAFVENLSDEGKELLELLDIAKYRPEGEESKKKK